MFNRYLKFIHMKKIMLLFVLLLGTTFTFAQNMQDVVYLNNGSVIRGTVLESRPDGDVKIKTFDGSVFVYAMSEVSKITKEEAVPMVKGSEKSPALAGILSALIPGAGQFYVGNNKQGWIDLAENVFSGIFIGIGESLFFNSVDENGYINTGEASNGLIFLLGGCAWGLTNEICSIVNAVRGARTINMQNGYAMMNIGNGVSAGFRPAINYDRNGLGFGNQSNFNAGLGFCIAF